MDHADWRFNVRASNTEPLVRLNVESRGNEALMREKTAELLAFLDSLGAVKANHIKWGHSSFPSKRGRTSFRTPVRKESSMNTSTIRARRCSRASRMRCAAQPPRRTTFPRAVENVAKAQITAGTLEAPIRFLASDALEGRGPATRGDTLARLYLAAELQSLGYLPGGEKGGWEQTVDVVGITAQLPADLVVHGQERRRRSQAGPRTTSPARGVQNAEPPLSRTRAWCSSATASKRPNTSGTTSRASTCKGKVLVMLNNDPDWDPKLFAGKTRLYYGRWTYKYESAARHGAAGVIIVHTTPSAGYPWQVVQSSWGGEQFELPAEGEPRIQLKAWATEDAVAPPGARPAGRISTS